MNHAPSSRTVLFFLSLLVGIEALAVTAAAAWLGFELLTVTPESYGTAISLFILVVIAAVWLILLTAQLRLGKPWTRPAALTWQILQLAVALGAFQGTFAQPAWGWVLLVPAIAVLILLFTPAATAALARHAEGDED